MPQYTVRLLEEDDLESVSRLHRYAFGGTRDAPSEDWTSWLKGNETFGLFEDEVLVSGVTLRPLVQSIRGVPKAMGGISAVASYPENRRRGHIRELFRVVFERMHERCMPVSMLSAFKRSYYRQFGYVPANTSPFAKTSGNHLQSLLSIRPNPAITIERVSMADARELYMDFVRAVCIPRYHGFAYAPSVSDWEWKDRAKDAVLAVARRDGRPVGIVKYRINVRRLELPGEDEQSLQILEMYWSDLEARDALLRFIGQHTGQVREVSLYMPLNEHLELWFPDAEWQMKTWQAWCVRVIDAQRSLMGLPAEQSGRIVMSITDESCGDSKSVLEVSERDGRLDVQSTESEPDCHLVSAGISALVYGTMAIDEIEHMGWARIGTDAARKLLRIWFPRRSIHNALEF